MKKIIYLFLALSVIAPGISSVQGPPEPATFGPSDVYFEGTTNWELRGGNLINGAQMRLKSTHTAVPTLLDVSYGPAILGDIKDTSNDPIIEMPISDIESPAVSATIYPLLNPTNFSNFIAHPYTSLYYALVENGKVIDILALTNRRATHFFTSKTGRDYRFITAAKNPINESSSRNIWVTRYMNAEAPFVRNARPTISTPTTGTGDCATEFGYLIRDLSGIRGKIYEFALNGCSGNTEAECENANEYFRGKKVVEVIIDSMLPYQDAFKKLQQLDLPGFIGTRMKKYEADSVVFEPKGLALLDQLATQAKEINDRVAFLEQNCKDFIDDKDNYPRSINRYNPEATSQQQLNNWDDVLKVVDEVKDLAKLAAYNPQYTAAEGTGKDWLTRIMNFVRCKVRNALIYYFYFLANFGAYFIRRNY